MMSFSKEQKIIEIGGLKLGGQPGELPTALFGTVFYGKKYKVMRGGGDDAALEAAIRGEEATEDAEEDENAGATADEGDEDADGGAEQESSEA